jgi:hypothetical protein
LLQQSLALARRHDAPREAAFCLIYLSDVTGWHDPQTRSDRLLQESLAISRSLDDQEGIANALFRLSEHASFLGNFGEAKQQAQESLAVCRRLGRKDWIAHAIDKLGYAAWNAGDYATSERAHEESYRLFAELGDRLGMALSLGGLGFLAWTRGADAAETLALWEQSLALCREIGHRGHTSSRLGALSWIANDHALHDLAYRYAQEGLTIAQEIDHPVFELDCHNGLADAACDLGRPAEGRQHLLAALHSAAEKGYQANHGHTLVILAKLLLREGAQRGGPDALDKQRQALELLTLAVDYPGCAHIFRERALRLRSQVEAALGLVATPVTAPPTTPVLTEVIARILVEVNA